MVYLDLLRHHAQQQQLTMRRGASDGRLPHGASFSRNRISKKKMPPFGSARTRAGRWGRRNLSKAWRSPCNGSWPRKKVAAHRSRCPMIRVKECLSLMENSLARITEKSRYGPSVPDSQQAGDYASAVGLYRHLPQFPESWNNLGVIWRLQGKDREADDAFRRALRNQPGLSEAAYNLGMATDDYWTKVHREYLPGSPMAAAPSGRIWVEAICGGTLHRRVLVAAAGELRPLRLDFADSASTRLAGRLPHSLIQAAPYLAIVLFVFPVLPVRQRPGRGGRILEVLFPGTSREWGYAGGFVLLAWIYLLLRLVLTHWLGSPYILTYLSQPYVVASYGPATSRAKTIALINPSWLALYAAPAAMFLLNLALTLAGWSWLRPGRRAASNASSVDGAESSQGAETCGSREP